MKFSRNFIMATDEVCDFDKSVPAPYLRKKFTLDFVPKKAEITITGLGFYELYINGENITKGPLAPYISNVNHICYYDNYDITDKLNKGENTIGILLGNGMRNAFGGFVWDFEKADFRGPLCTALCLEAYKNEKDNRDTNNSNNPEESDADFVLEADETFKTHPSPIIFDDIRMGCHYDAKLEIPGWADVDYDDSDWKNALKCKAPKGRPELCKAEPIKYHKEIKPVSVTHFDTAPFAYEHNEKTISPKDFIPDKRAIAKDVYIYDFGEVNAGITSLKINGKPGQVIKIGHMEFLVNGIPTIKNISFPQYTETYDKYIDYSQKDVFICKGGEETFVPKFKYDGFRYAFVEGLEPEQATLDALTYHTMGSDIKCIGDFESSCPTLNKLYDMVLRSDLSNFFYFPTDCPQREKNGWTGDAAVSAEQILMNFDASDSLEIWLDNVRLSQSDTGELPGIIPTDTWGYYTFGPVWDSVCVMLPYNIYRFKGDKKVIKDNSAMIMRHLYFQKIKMDNDGLLDYGLGDWCAPLKTEENRDYDMPRKFTSTAFECITAKRAAELFEITEQYPEAEYANSLAEELKNNIRKHLIDFDTMTVIGESQTSQALAMYAGIFNEDEYAKAGERLLEIINMDNVANTCGVIGLRVIYHVLIGMGKGDVAYKLITSTARGCYGSWIKAGATSMWESFPHDDGSYMNSQNHHFLGDIGSLFIQAIAGIRPNPHLKDLAEFEITPDFITDLDYAKASFESKFGTLKSYWKRDGDSIKLEVCVPDGMYGYLKLPHGYVSDLGDKKLIVGCYEIKINKI